MENGLDVLTARGLVEQVTDEDGIRTCLNEGPVSIYAGFDPTGPSLHIGHMLPIMALAQLQRAGHRPIVLVGGATGMIGDPSGKSEERQLLTPEIVGEYSRLNKQQLAHFIDFDGENAAIMVNNYDWVAPMTYIEWLREVGKYFSVNMMIGKESVRRRLEDRNQGISYTEFSYMLVQAYDFLHLSDAHGCKIEVGGSDQWGNITAGIELIRKRRGRQAYGITFPLITTASGEKFGKSAGNAVWLDPEATSPYEFYQYWIRTDDRDVDRYLKYFTFLELDEVAAIVVEHEQEPHRRLGQRRLAEEVTRLVHGEESVSKAQRASKVLFGGDVSGLSDRDLREIFKEVPSSDLKRTRLGDGIPFIDLCAEAGVCKSKGEARRLVRGGGIYLNNQKISDERHVVRSEDLASESMLVLRAGKKNYHLVRFD